jgi:organic hydroperoxide reductase OsmC/OhrA
MSPDRPKSHVYASRLIWEGNLGQGTASYTVYGREYRILIADKPDLLGTADAAFRGVPDRHNPEDLFLASLSACHMLSYLALCARQGIQVVAYEDDASGTLELRSDGGGRFTEVTLRPRVTIADAKHEGVARELHAVAHDRCFIANSVSVPVHHDAAVHVDPNWRSAIPNETSGTTR